MKKLLFLFLSIWTLGSVAQERLILKTSDGKQLDIPVWQIESLQFQPYEIPQTTVGEAVDLGLRSGVKWSSLNIGATQPEERGLLFGWGNEDATNLSSDLKYYPSKAATTNIINHPDHDVARKYWGEDWRMPSVQDFQELLDQCEWAWDGEKKAYKVSNVDDDTKFIYLPVTGYSIGAVEDLLDQDQGFYWTGNVAANDSASYLGFPVDENNPLQLLEGYRARHFAVRPVSGEFHTPISIQSENDEPQTNMVNITIRLTGEGKEVKYGVMYSTVSGVESATATKTETITLSELDSEETHTFVLRGLSYGTTYYYRAYVIVGADLIVEEDEHSFTTEEDNRLVDLGLGVRWARWNLGAIGLGDYGTRDRWAAQYHGGPANESADVPENISGTEYDLAHNLWGDEWRMPTTKEFKELYKYCTMSDTMFVGVNGFIYGTVFRRKGYDDYVFLPYAGVGDGSSPQWLGSVGYYWTANNLAGALAYECKVTSQAFEEPFKIADCEKIGARAIRPVYGKYDKTRLVGVPDSEIETPVVVPDDPTDDPSEPDTPPTPETPEAEKVTAVDLGLTSGTLWANMNIGATQVYEAGNYYSWGEIEPKENYLLSYYQYYSEDNGYSVIGQAQGRTRELAGLADYDPTVKEWGGKWVMPTSVQFKELIDECTWTWVAEEELAYTEGYRITSKKNNKSIFLPAANCYTSSYAGPFGIGYYWTSSFYPYDTQGYIINRFAYAFFFDNPMKNTALTDEEKVDYLQMIYNSRSDGMPIRPVMKK